MLRPYHFTVDGVELRGAVEFTLETVGEVVGHCAHEVRVPQQQTNNKDK